MRVSLMDILAEAIPALAGLLLAFILTWAAVTGFSRLALKAARFASVSVPDTYAQDAVVFSLFATMAIFIALLHYAQS